MHILDLDQETFSSDVQTNVQNIHGTYSEHFAIKIDDEVLPVRLHKLTHDSNGQTFFELCYDQPMRTSPQPAFVIWFYDTIKRERNSTAILEYVNATDTYTGTQLVQFILCITRALGVTKLLLQDKATINCHGYKLSLSFQKLIEKKQTFYMRFGFDVEILDSHLTDMPFDSKEKWHQKVDELHEKISNISIASLVHSYSRIAALINAVNQIEDYDNFQIKYLAEPNIRPADIYFEGNVEETVLTLYQDCQQMLEVLGRTAESYLTAYLVSLFNANSIDYITMNKLLLTSNIIEISYLDQHVELPCVAWFKYLRLMQSMSVYAYDFG